jgi:small subunit ribosomal protein S20
VEVPNTSTAKKRLRQSAKRRARNRVKRAALRTALKKTRTAESPEAAAAAYHSAEQLLDRAAQKGLISKNKAARHKSRLSRLVAQKVAAR